jgi:hypothetical protein
LWGAEREINVLKRILVCGFVFLLVTGPLSVSWAAQQESPRIQDMVDLVVLRPIGCLVTLGGTGLFVVTLPFTVPTHSTKRSAEMFVVRPFRYTFARPFPDENL